MHKHPVVTVFGCSQWNISYFPWFFFFFCVPQLHLWGSPFWVRFLCMWPFFNPTIEVVTFRLCGWCMLGVFLLPAFTHLGQERQDLLSLCDVRWNACVHRLDLGLYFHPKEFWGNGVRTHVNFKGKIPSTRMILHRGGWNPWRCIKQDSQPNTLPFSYSGPHQAGQPAQHTTNQLFQPPSSRTASPTHYHPAGQPAQHTTNWAIPAPIKQDSQPNTLPSSYSGPHQAGQPAQHTTNQLFQPPSSRTASPTHYQPAIPAPIKQDSQPNTLPTSYSGPHQAGQPAQHTTNQLFQPPSSRTASPTHYQPAIPAPIKQDSQPNTLPTSYSGPHQAGQPAQHTTNQLIRPPSSRTASPTHYQPAIPAPIKQDSQPNTLPTSYSGPHQAGQPAQHTTNQLFRPPSSRTASPTHYHPAIPAPIKQDSQPNTLPTSRTASPTHYHPAIPAHIKQDSQPNTLPTSYSSPHQAGQPAQHTTIQLFRPNTLPTSYSGPHQAGQPAQHTTIQLFRPNTLPTSYSGPHQAGQPAQHTTIQLFRPNTLPTSYSGPHQAGQPAQHTTIQQDSQPNTLPSSYSGPHQTGQPAQHTTIQLFWPPSNRTASPTHYQPAIPAPIKQDSQPNTLPSSYSGPHQAGQPAQHTTIQLFQPPSSRTASPTHYHPAIPAQTQ